MNSLELHQKDEKMALIFSLKASHLHRVLTTIDERILHVSKNILLMEKKKSRKKEGYEGIKVTERT